MLRSDCLSYYWAICYSPPVVKSAGFLTAKKDLSLALTSWSFDILTNWLDFTKTIILLALMASESVAHAAFGLMGYWLTAHNSYLLDSDYPVDSVI